jgi:AraC-like DNA-binding protein
LANPFGNAPKLKLWTGSPDALSRDYDADLFQPSRPEDSLRIRPVTWRAEGYREILDIEEGFSVVIGDIKHLEDALMHRKAQNPLNFHFRLTGNSEIEVEGKEPLVVHQQSLVLLLSPQGIEKSERFFRGEHEQSVTICCQPEFIARRFHDGGQLPKALRENLEGNTDHSIFASASLSVQMASAVRSLIENQFEQDLRRVHIEAKALELLVLSLSALLEVENRSERSLAQIGERDMARVEKVRAILDETFLEPPSITKLARKVGVNEAKLMHLFKQQVGETIFNYTQRLKMERAKELLETTDISVTEIAFDVGYEYSSNFTTAFRRHFGVTPRVAREAQQG